MPFGSRASIPKAFSENFPEESESWIRSALFDRFKRVSVGVGLSAVAGIEYENLERNDSAKVTLGAHIKVGPR